MKMNNVQSFSKALSIIAVLLFFNSGFSQEASQQNPENNFWKNVQFGGGLGLGFGSGYTDITIAPTAIYNFNEYFSLGTGVQYSYLRQKGFFKNLEGRIVTGVPSHLVDFCQLPNIGKVRARKLYEHGIKTIDDLLQKDASEVKKILNMKKENIDEIIKEARRLSIF
jgi:hypothetical protein